MPTNGKNFRIKSSGIYLMIVFSFNYLNSGYTFKPSVQNKFQFPYFFRTPDNLLIDLRLFDNGKRSFNKAVKKHMHQTKFF